MVRRFFIEYSYLHKNVLAHHGVKGMKWGVWNSETRKRYSGYVYPEGIMKKGTRLARASTVSSDKKYKHDPLSGNVKYVSTNPEDHQKWADYFHGSGKQAYGIMYKTTADIKIASATKVGNTYANMVLDKNGDKAFKKESSKIYKNLSLKKMGLKRESFEKALNNKNYDEDTKNSIKQVVASIAVKNQDDGVTKSGQAIVKKLFDEGYGGMQDALGWNVATDPLIIFNPRKNLEVEYDQRVNS